MSTVGAVAALPPIEPPMPGGRAPSVGLWVFIGVASTLFTLFLTAYVMRMQSADWSPVALPWQLWLSTSCLVAGSVLMQAAAVQARRVMGAARALLPAAGICAFAFVGVQLWAWQVLQAAHVMPAGNPAASFFYLLTTMHGLHVLGGLVGWGLVQRRGATARNVALCARYWHFLLAVWLVLFATLGLLTPEIARYICGNG